MTAPRLGVVVAAWNAERWLGETLASLRAQSCTGWECVVVDDGSTDGTGALAREHADADERVRVVRRENGGLSAARNTGLAQLAADTPLVTFVDADDLYVDGGLERLVRALEGRPDAVGVLGLAEYCDEQGAAISPGLHPGRQRDRRGWSGRRLVPLAPGCDSRFADLVEYGPGWPSIVAVLRADAVRGVGGFDESVTHREDWDLHLRLSRRGPFAVVDEQVAWYRRHGSNLTRGLLIGELMQQRVVIKAYDSAANDADQRRVLRRSAGRRHLAGLRETARRLLSAVRAGSVRAASYLSLALLWSLAEALRRRPAQPSRRHVWWAAGRAHGAPDQDWVG